MKDKVHEAEIVEVSEETAAAVFDGSVKLIDVLDSITSAAKESAAGLDPETSTGRDEIKSVAYKVARSKTLLDSTGKDAVDGIKKQAKAIDSQRKEARDFLDALRDEIKQPVIDWGAEQQRKIDEATRLEEEAAEAKRVAAEEAEALRIADIERREAALQAAEDEAEAARAKEVAKVLAEQQKKEQAEREAQIAKEATEKAKREAEEAGRIAKEAAERREAEMKQRAEQAEADHLEAVEQARIDQEAAVQKAKDDAAAEAARIQAVNDEAERKSLAAAEKKAANTKHRAKVNNEVIADLMDNVLTITPDDAKALVTAIAKGKINNVTINY